MTPVGPGPTAKGERRRDAAAHGTRAAHAREALGGRQKPNVFCEERDLKGLPGDLLTSPAHLAPRWPKMYPCAPAVTCPFNVRTRTFNTNFIHTRALCSRVETAPRALSQPPLSARTTIRVEPLSVCLGHPSAHFAGHWAPGGSGGTTNTSWAAHVPRLRARHPASRSQCPTTCTVRRAQPQRLDST